VRHHRLLEVNQEAGHFSAPASNLEHIQFVIIFGAAFYILFSITGIVQASLPPF
jgi:hypothetical protein